MFLSSRLPMPSLPFFSSIKPTKKHIVCLCMVESEDYIAPVYHEKKRIESLRNRNLRLQMGRRIQDEVKNRFD